MRQRLAYVALCIAVQLMRPKRTQKYSEPVFHRKPLEILQSLADHPSNLTLITGTCWQAFQRHKTDDTHLHFVTRGLKIRKNA